MNNRFKFRVWDKQISEMSYDVCIGFVKDGATRDWVCADTSCGQVDYTDKRLKDIVLMQCTGLKDKNGKLIYEGDIMLVYEKIKEVVYWGKRQFMLGRTHIYCTNCKKNHYKRTCPTCYKFQSTTATTTIKNFEKSEVIGNIYENKELLNE